ncbi:MAG TPA: hypothetical protein VKQ32_20425 [Polyangia bacterium]|nr:hypothetical protein [Polyangia bacterium]
MNDVTSKSSSPILAAGGAGFLVLAAVFLVRDLALPPETLLGAAAVLAVVLALLRPPRRLPWIGPAALLAVAVVGGGWFLAVASPALLPGLGVVAVGSIASVAMHERRAAQAPSSDLARRLAWYAAGAAFLVASGAFYVHFFTLGFADESPARRLIPTISWLAIGLALWIAAPNRDAAPGRVAIGFVAIAVLKALVYDSTHLQGPLRVTVFAAVGALLLAGARIIARREHA